MCFIFPERPGDYHFRFVPSRVLAFVFVEFAVYAFSQLSASECNLTEWGVKSLLLDTLRFIPLRD